jgi:hypothetical protein
MASLVEHGRTGLHFRPGDAGDLAVKIEWAAAHPEEMGRMRREARAEYVAKYTPERNYEMLTAIYRHATRQSSDPQTCLGLVETEARCRLQDEPEATGKTRGNGESISEGARLFS